MTAFDLLFIACAPAAVGALVMAAVKRDRAGVILRRIAVCAAIYMGVVLAVSAISARKVYGIGDERCFDDWCITVTRVGRTSTGEIEVGLRLSSRAKGAPQGEKGTAAYLTDSNGQRYDPLPDVSSVPFDYQLGPGEAIETKRVFRVPEQAKELGFVYAGAGPGGFVIGENYWFHGPPIVRLGIQ